MEKINGLEYINRSTTRTPCRPKGHPQPHIHHTVHRTSVGSITSITSITNTTIATTHTYAHIHTPTTVPAAAASSQHHNIVPFQSTTNTFATFNLHFTAAHTTTQPSTYLYLFHRLRAIQPHTLYKQKHKTKRTTQMA